MDSVSNNNSRHHNEDERSTTKWIKISCGLSSAVCFCLGLRAARAQAAPWRPGELSRRSLLSGTGLAMQAFGIATVLSVSGYILLLVAVSGVLGVNTWKQFGQKMTNFFGDRLRIPKGTSEGASSFAELLEMASQDPIAEKGEKIEKF
ncbi:hypothetical protein GPALN_014766 [Globodera pallida]|nr:hypothetical protein GPALN_014766 [Globodera pallida]